MIDSMIETRRLKNVVIFIQKKNIIFALSFLGCP